MRANRRVDTGPERLLRSELHARGLRFRKDHPVPMANCRPRPDIVFTAARLAVFVDGCFWHGCGLHRSLPKSNAEFWRRKIQGNQARDRRHDRALREAGWAVVRVWEHTSVDEAADLIERQLQRAQEAAHSP